MLKKLLLVAPVAGVVGLGIGVGTNAWLGSAYAAGDEPVAAKQDLKPAVTLPITRVVLFNSGVSYISRSAEIEGDARVDLTFPEADINDLLKSMVLEDFGKGRISAVSYDSREPIARTLSSFAVNLDGNPTFAGIVSQMRGERVEIAISPTAANQPGKLVGTIVGVESQKVPAGTTTVDVSVLNMWCAEGMRAVRMSDIQSLRFTNPVVESEFRRALEVLSLAHDSQKKAVQIHFAGEGKRRVQVGYVVEAPIWKTSYRLLMNEKEKPYLQGWAMVENPTDEDWTNVKMALVSGRPISFKMDLYNPLYIDRPTVGLELFASLRPVTYRGGFGDADKVAGDFKKLEEKQKANKDLQAGLGAQPGQGGMGMGHGPGGPQPGRNGFAVAPTTGVSDEKLRGRTDHGAVLSAATAGQLGDNYQYVIDHPVNLARQKSALLPIVGKDIEGTKVSIYNQAVQAKHPLLGLRLKNTTGAHLNQGPITVFEGSVYAGDTKVLDVQPNEERLLSYAIDLGTEVDPKAGAGAQKITSVKASKGIVVTTTKVTDEKTYRIVNRSQTDRVLLIEHPNRTAQQFKIVDTPKQVEDTPEVYRFQVSVKASETKSFTVKEERDVVTSVTLTNGAEDTMRYFISLTEASPELKKKLQDALKVKGEWDGVRRDLEQIVRDLNRLSADQDRIRKNLRETPKESELYETYLKKLAAQEKEIDALTAKQKKLMDDEFASRKKYETFLASISD